MSVIWEKHWPVNLLLAAINLHFAIIVGYGLSWFAFGFSLAHGLNRLVRNE